MSNIHRFEIPATPDTTPDTIYKTALDTYTAVAELPPASEVLVGVNWGRDITSISYSRPHPNASIEVPSPLTGYMMRLGTTAIRNVLIERFTTYPDLETIEQVYAIQPSTATRLWQAIRQATDGNPYAYSRPDFLSITSPSAEDATLSNTDRRIIGMNPIAIDTLVPKMILNPENFGLDPQKAHDIAVAASLLLLVGREAFRNATSNNAPFPADDDPAWQKNHDWKADIYELDSLNRLTIGNNVIEALKNLNYQRLSHVVRALGSGERLWGISTKSKQAIWEQVQHILPAVCHDMTQAIADNDTGKLPLAS